MAAGKSTSRMGRGGSPTADRLASRAQKGALSRQSMPGGGEVFTGDLASRALKSLGARAMTVDRSIVVSDEFDPNRPEDQALYAHEQYHVDHSGGEGTHEARDAEEVAARSVERMVLHRAMAGGAESHEAAHAVPGGTGDAQSVAQEKTVTAEKADAAQRGYAAMRAKGMSHVDVVNKLAGEVVSSMDAQRELRLERYGDKKGFL